MTLIQTYLSTKRNNQSLVIFIAMSLQSQALKVLPFKATTILMKVFVNIFHTAGLSIMP